YRHGAYPFDVLVEELDLPGTLSHAPIFDILIAYHSSMESGGPEAAFHGLRTTTHHDEGEVSKYDLTFNFGQTDGGIEMTIEYNTDLYRKETIERICDHYRELVRSVVISNGQQVIDELNYVSDWERVFVTKSLQGERQKLKMATIHSLIEARALQVKEKPAVGYEGKILTYGELNTMSNQLARFLRKRGVRREDRIAMIMDRSEKVHVTILGILKSGASYVPIDPEYPADRTEYMLEDTGVKIVITDSGYRNEDMEVIDWQNDWKQISNESGDHVVDINEPTDLAYIIYTSGSTGRPKGVMIEHHNFVNFHEGTLRSFNFPPETHILAAGPFTFDMSVFELLCPLVEGFRVTINPTDGHGGFDKYIAVGVNTLAATPSRITNMFEDEGSRNFIRSLSMMMPGGEVLKNDLLQRLLNETKAELFNIYGPTEITMWATYDKIDRDKPHVTLGRPVLNTNIYIAGRGSGIQGVGGSGEILISGGGVMRGYLNKVELTHEKVITTTDNPTERKYRTGDLGRLIGSGKLQYLGRIDHQVKLRGYRIELEEIESRLWQLEGVEDAVVLVKGAS
ncbi:MAG: non-ribosomal peptide synthetase, partial [Flammeovirgaceae bacterium]